MKLADPTLLKHQCLIDGAWVGEGVDAIHNPATGALIAKVPRFGHADTVGAIEAAEKAFGPGRKRFPKSGRKSCDAGSISSSPIARTSRSS